MMLTSGHRTALTGVAAASFLGRKGVFLYYLAVRSRELIATLSHPAALVFVIYVMTVLEFADTTTSLKNHRIFPLSGAEAAPDWAPSSIEGHHGIHQA